MVRQLPEYAYMGCCMTAIDGRRIAVGDGKSIRIVDTFSDKVESMIDFDITRDQLLRGSLRVQHLLCVGRHLVSLVHGWNNAPTLKVWNLATHTRVRTIETGRNVSNWHANVVTVDDNHVLYNELWAPSASLYQISTGQATHVDFQGHLALPVVVADNAYVVAVTSPYDRRSHQTVRVLQNVPSRDTDTETFELSLPNFRRVYKVEALPRSARVVFLRGDGALVMCMRNRRALIFVPKTLLVAPGAQVSLVPLSPWSFAFHCKTLRGEITLDVATFKHDAHSMHRVNGTKGTRSMVCPINDYHFMAAYECDTLRLAVFSACDERTHMAAWQIARHWRACSANPAFKLCRRLLLETRTDEQDDAMNEAVIEQSRVRRSRKRKLVEFEA